MRTLLPRLFSSVSVLCAYVGSGLQMFLAMALLAWMPSFLDRSYGLPPAKAGLAAGAFALITGIGMVGGGMAAHRLGRRKPHLQVDRRHRLQRRVAHPPHEQGSNSRPAHRNSSSSASGPCCPTPPQGLPPPWWRA